jgi:glutaredoxin
MDFVIYVLEGCPYCLEALELLRSRKCKYRKIVVLPQLKSQINAQNVQHCFLIAEK